MENKKNDLLLKLESVNLVGMKLSENKFPKENGKLMENSEDFQAECTHIMCSMLPAMQPEIIYKYPEKDSKEYK